MTEEKTPSMEQILKNIRGVISGEEEQAEPDILELTEIINDDGSISSIAAPEDNAGPDVLDFIDDALGVEKKEKVLTPDTNISTQTDSRDENSIDELLEKQPQHKAIDAQATQEESVKKSRLISDKTASEAEEAIKVLVKTVSKPISDGLEFRSGTSVEDLTIELIRPYLSKWLDNNLPSIVKHLVEKEIQKLIPKDED